MYKIILIVISCSMLKFTLSILLFLSFLIASISGSLFAYLQSMNIQQSRFKRITHKISLCNVISI